MDSTAAEIRRRDQFRELAAGIIAAMIAATAFGVLAPTSMELVTFDQLLYQQGINMSLLIAGLLAFLGAFVVAMLGWIVLVERRRPWPIGPRVPGPRGPHWASAAAIAVAMTLPRLVSGSTPDVSGLYSVPGSDSLLLDVSSPIDIAQPAVIMFATWGVAYTLATAFGVIRRERQHQTESSGSSATVRQNG